MDFLIDFDKHLFFILNGWHHPLLDSFWWVVTQRIYWIPLYAWFFYVLVKEWRNRVWIPLVLVTLLIILSDQGANFAKEYYHRLRPCHRIEWEGMVHTVNNYCGGKFGFFSGHAANASSLAYFMWLFVASRKQSKAWLGLLITYAMLVSISRIFLGVHFPFDIAGGWIYGCLCAWLMFRIALRIAPDMREEKG